MSLFRKKPIVIEAVQVNATDFSFQGGFDGNPFNEVAPPWLMEALKSGVIVPDTPGSTDYAEWKIPTLEGDMWAGPGDWIIRGVAGELYPCRPDIFEASYDPVAAEGVAP